MGGGQPVPVQASRQQGVMVTLRLGCRRVLDATQLVLPACMGRPTPAGKLPPCCRRPVVRKWLRSGAASQQAGTVVTPMPGRVVKASMLAADLLRGEPVAGLPTIWGPRLPAHPPTPPPLPAPPCPSCPHDPRRWL